LLHESSVSRPAAPAVHLVETGAAFVRDTSVAGPTSPILGARYRFGVSPTFGSLTTATVVADVRKYVMPVRPFAIARRLQHFARVGSDAWDPRMTPLVWTLRDLVRGYGDTLDTSACASSHDCTSTDGLIIARYAVANAELRFPVLGVLRRRADYGSIPLEGFV